MNYLFRTAVAAFICLSIFACSKGNDSATAIDPRTGKHPSDWAVATTGGNHPAVASVSQESCKECHGQDLRGGISKVSCFTAGYNGIGCHPGGPGHPAGFDAADIHGARAKAVLGGVNGMATCKGCHGTDYRGAGNSAKNCIGCHQLTTSTTNAPHSPAPWRGGNRSHATVHESNAAACAQCHTAGANLATSFQLASYATGTPGCFNSTLCHGIVGHSNESRQPWDSGDNHGAAAKGSPTAGDGMALCKSCHGLDLKGKNTAVSCFSCHTTAPHAQSPWRRSLAVTTGRIHTDTNPANAVVCAGCHLNKARLTTPVAITGSPGCFDNSMCHGTTGHADTSVFPVQGTAWNQPVNHGAKAKGSTAIGSSGFSSCRTCHGDGSTQFPLFQGGTALTSCMTLGCHSSNPLKNVPHPVAPWRGTTASGSVGHATTDTSNAAVCAACHTNGALSSRQPTALDVAGTTGCFNATMCHGITGHTDTTVYPAPWGAATNHGAFARSEPVSSGVKGLAYCQHCHSTTFSGGVANQSCYPCHGVSAPHPAKANWNLAAGTLSHVNTGTGNATVCDDCHNATTKNLTANFITLFANSPAGSFKGGTGGCYNASMCHGDVRKTTNCDACHITAATTVGVHGAHLNASISTNVACNECHTVPTTPVIAGLHRNVITEVPLAGTLTRTGGNPLPTYTTSTCTNTYCHGAKMPEGDVTGSNQSPAWDNTNYLTGTIADCGVCHGFPPTSASGHLSVATPISFAQIGTLCAGCHSDLNASASSYATIFSNKAQHIDGSLQAASSHNFPYSGALHKAATGAANGTGCLSASCHAQGTSASPYPIAGAVGTRKPACRSCHLNANPGTDPQCSDCHGLANNNGIALDAGRPNGSTFPNRAGSIDGHNRGTHRVACTTCHPFTTGNPAHGWSGGTKSIRAQVGGPGTNITTWTPPSAANSNRGSCTPTCHGSEAWY